MQVYFRNIWPHLLRQATYLVFSRRPLLCFCLFWTLNCLQAQSVDRSQLKDLLQKSKELLLEQNLSGASTLAQKSLALAKDNHWEEEEGSCYLMLAEISYQQDRFTEALSFAIQATTKFELSHDTGQKISSYRLLAEIYTRTQIYQRAIFYNEKLEKLYREDSTAHLSLADLYFERSKLYLNLQDYATAETYAFMALEKYQLIVYTAELTEVHELIVNILQQQQKYEQAIPHALWLKEIYGTEKEYEKQIASLNTLGFLYQRTDEKKKALEAFKQAVLMSTKAGHSPSTSLLVNLGLAYSNIGNNKQAIKYYQSAAEKCRSHNDLVGLAEVNNYLASHFFLSGRQRKALETAEKANEMALQQQDLQLLSDNYLLQKLIYSKEEYWNKARALEQKRQQVESQIQQKSASEKERIAHINQIAEIHEQEVRMTLNESEKAALEKERKDSQIRFQEQELSLLKKEKELKDLALEKQKLESKNANQALAIIKQQLLSEQQAFELESLNRSKQLQELRINKQALEQQQQEQTIKLLESDRQLKQERLQQESRMRRYSWSILALCIITLLVLVFFFVLKTRDNRILKKQKHEILTKNQLLSENEEVLKNHLQYLEEARHLMSEQKEQLMAVHNRVQESIEYARHIQVSILPDDTYLKAMFPESYVIFMPKDVVSGDFYWVSHHNNIQVVIVADCTGHGVPGALITLIGHSLLTEAIQVHQMTEPDAILYFLHHRLLNRFQSTDSTRQHGMDMSICVIERLGQQTWNLYYAGAKSSLWLVKEGKLQRIKGDRYSVGSRHREIGFTCHRTQMQNQDVFYLSSDGFIDQPNPERKRLGSSKLSKYIEDWHQLPMIEQEKKFLTAFYEHKQEAELRDDVTLLGIRL